MTIKPLDKENTKQQVIAEELAKMLFDSSRVSLFASLTLSMVMVWALWPVSDTSIMTFWAVVSVLLFLFRLALTIIYLKKGREQSAEQWLKLFNTGAICSALVWAWGEWYFYPQQSIELQAFMGVLILGLSAGGLSSLSASRNTAIAFLLIINLPLDIRFLSSDIPVIFTLGLLQILLFVMLISSTLRINKSLLQNMQLRVESDSREQALRSSEEKFRSFFEKSGEGIVIVELDGRILKINMALSNILGYSLDEIINKTLDNLTYSEDIGIFKSEFKKLLSSDKDSSSFENRYVNKDGHVFWSNTHVTLVRDKNNRPIHFIGHIEDISERKDTELRLRQTNDKLAESQGKYRLLFEFSDDPMWLIVGEQFMFANWAASRILGYDSPYQLEKAHPSELSPLYQEDGVLSSLKANEMICRALEVGYNRFEWLHKKRSGVIFPAEVSLTKVPYEGTEALFCVWRDISERKEFEKELIEANHEAQQASRAKSQFLATMSHEIRTPMNGVIGMTSLLMDTQLNKEQQHFTEIIRESGEALLSIINDILDFSKLEAQHLELEESHFALTRLADGVVDILSPKANAEGLELISNISPEVCGTYKGDPGRIRQTLMNLLGNAVKFTENGRITLKIDRIRNDSSTNSIRFEVIDTGIGIEPEKLDHLFDSFVQGDASITRKYGGTGLGLSISNRLVDAMGGKIGVESTPGEGSKFWFELPLIYISDRDSEQLDIELKAIAGKQVLLVADNSTEIEILFKTLESWHIDVDLVRSATEGLAKLKNTVNKGDSYDAVIADLQDSNNSDTELIKNIRKHAEFENIPIVQALSIPRSEYLKDNPESEASSYFNRPVEQSDFLEVVISILSGESNTSTKPLTSEVSDMKSQSSSLKVLLAEDIVVNQMVARKLIEKFGHRVDVVSNGLEAVEAVKNLPYDLVFMDLLMPEMDGLSATRRIRQLEEGKGDIQIVAMTANATNEDVQACIEAGMNDFVSKPVHKEKLAESLLKVSNALNNKSN